MLIDHLIVSLQEYWKLNTQNQSKSDEIIDWIETYGELAFKKENFKWHVTGSLLIMNREKTKVLLMFHKKLQLWLQFGGHADGEIDTENVAIREFHEESGIAIEPEIVWWIFDVDVHDIPADQKWRPMHQHYDILYLATIPEDTPFSMQVEEVDDIRWFDIEGLSEYVGEKRMLDMMEKIKKLSHV
jgi:8-oxo-dGTP pyrophosphatase MutT (NUDIX family)